MRTRKQDNSITVNAIGGTHVVLLGLDIDASKRAGFLGFAIQRTEAKTGNVFWMKGMKTFEATMPNTSPGKVFRPKSTRSNRSNGLTTRSRPAMRTSTK